MCAYLNLRLYHVWIINRLLSCDEKSDRVIGIDQRMDTPRQTRSALSDITNTQPSGNLYTFINPLSTAVHIRWCLRLYMSLNSFADHPGAVDDATRRRQEWNAQQRKRRAEAWKKAESSHPATSLTPTVPSPTLSGAYLLAPYYGSIVYPSAHIKYNNLRLFRF